jgi:hypothetical protein
MRRWCGASLLLVTMASACGSSSPSPTTVPECPGTTLPSTLQVTVSGFDTCKCFDGTFTLTESGTGVWSSAAINGCPGQTKAAYVKLSAPQMASGGGDGLNGGASADAGPYANIGFGITDSTSTPGFGNSDLAVPTSVTCSPLSIRGGGARAGNINAFCPSTEDENMTWSVGP